MAMAFRASSNGARDFLEGEVCGPTTLKSVASPPYQRPNAYGSLGRKKQDLT